MKSKISIFGVFLFLLLTSSIYAQGPSNATMSEIANLIHKTLEKNGFDDIGVDMRKDEFGVVDFDIYFDENFTSDKFYLVAGSVIGIIAALTRRTSWKSNKVYFCTVLDYEDFAWIYTKDCRKIMTINDPTERGRAIKEKIRINN